MKDVLMLLLGGIICTIVNVFDRSMITERHSHLQLATSLSFGT